MSYLCIQICIGNESTVTFYVNDKHSQKSNSGFRFIDQDLIKLTMNLLILNQKVFLFMRN